MLELLRTQRTISVFFYSISPYLFRTLKWYNRCKQQLPQVPQQQNAQNYRCFAQTYKTYLRYGWRKNWEVYYLILFLCSQSRLPWSNTWAKLEEWIQRANIMLCETFWNFSKRVYTVCWIILAFWLESYVARLMVSALVSGLSGPGSSPGRRDIDLYCRVVLLGKTYDSHSA